MNASKVAIQHGFRPVPRTGVIYVMTEAAKHGYSYGNAEWSNLGQGAPATGAIDGSGERIINIDVTEPDFEYAPVDGLLELRKAVANLYNARFRKNKSSQYTWKNVAISAGGRVALTRLISTLGQTNVGHFLPDYTAYEELLESFKSFVSIPIPLSRENNYNFTAQQLEKEILGRGLSTVLLSNPCNPTGKLIHGEELQSWTSLSQRLGCTMIFDEFYSHYTYVDDSTAISAAEYVEDVNEDPVVIVDGLTKNWRCPGWRVSWTLAPEPIIDALGSSGSFLDGGCARPMQKAAIPLVDLEQADKEAKAIKSHFIEKRSLMIDGLEKLGIKIPLKPEGGFYCWGDVSGLPGHINDGMSLFREALKEQVIIVPGEFFDINPGQRRPDRPGRLGNYARFSFGPSTEELQRGLSKLERIIL